MIISDGDKQQSDCPEAECRPIAVRAFTHRVSNTARKKDGQLMRELSPRELELLAKLGRVSKSGVNRS